VCPHEASGVAHVLPTTCTFLFSAAAGNENVVLQAAGLERTGLVSKEAEAALHAALQQVVFKADTGRIEILFKPSGNVQVWPPVARGA